MTAPPPTATASPYSTQADTDMAVPALLAQGIPPITDEEKAAAKRLVASHRLDEADGADLLQVLGLED